MNTSSSFQGFPSLDGAQPQHQPVLPHHHGRGRRGHQEAGADTGGESNKKRKVKEGEEALDSNGICLVQTRQTNLFDRGLSSRFWHRVRVIEVHQLSTLDFKVSKKPSHKKGKDAVEVGVVGVGESFARKENTGVGLDENRVGEGKLDVTPVRFAKKDAEI